MSRERVYRNSIEITGKKISRKVEEENDKSQCEGYKFKSTEEIETCTSFA